MPVDNAVPRKMAISVLNMHNTNLEVTKQQGGLCEALVIVLIWK